MHIEIQLFLVKEREFSLTHSNRKVIDISLRPTVEQLPLRHMMAERNNEKDSLQRMKGITKLYRWFRLVARSEASLL